MTFSYHCPTGYKVAVMNEAFGNPKGKFDDIDYSKLANQCINIFDEYCELLSALGMETVLVEDLKRTHSRILMENGYLIHSSLLTGRDTDAIRDALCDIQVFASGAQHLMGVDGDADMHEVVSKVMTRFVKDDADKEATIAKHAAKGVTEVYFEGAYPTMVMKSAKDQPDAPKGKFLKSASFSEPVFANPQTVSRLNALGLTHQQAWLAAAAIRVGDLG